MDLKLSDKMNLMVRFGKRISIDFLGSRAQDDRAAGQVHQWISHKTVYILYSSFCVLVYVIIQKPDIG